MSQIREVSKLAGVSPATVSRAYTDPSKLSEATLRKVRAAAEQLDYKPNSLARLFRGKRTNSILVMVPNLQNVVFAQVLSGIERVAAEKGYFLLVVNTHDDIETERGGIELVETHRVDGVIQLGGRPLKFLHKHGDEAKVHFVHVMDAIEPGPYPCVSIDNVAASEAIATYLMGLGHRRVGVVAGIKDREVTEARLQGFRKAQAAFDLPYDPSLVAFGEFSFAGGADSARRLLSRHSDITALFCMSDEIAIGAIRTINDRGLSVPEDISVTGFDDIDAGRFCSPPLTTVLQPAVRMGELGMAAMCDLLEGEEVSENRQKLPTELVIRASAQRPAK